MSVCSPVCQIVDKTCLPYHVTSDGDIICNCNRWPDALETPQQKPCKCLFMHAVNEDFPKECLFVERFGISLNLKTGTVSTHKAHTRQLLQSIGTIKEQGLKQKESRTSSSPCSLEHGEL